MIQEPKTIPEVIRLHAKKSPDKVWGRFSVDGRGLTYSEIERLGILIAGGFQQAGIAKGDRVAIMLDNVSDFVLAWFGLAFAGAVMVPINTFFKSQECGYILNHARVKGVICSSEYLNLITEAAPLGVIVWSVDGGPREFQELLQYGAGDVPSIGESDAAGILYTSGTTGNPKGCIESHRFYLRAGGSFRDTVGVVSEDVVLTPLPLFHANPQIIAIMGSLMAGATVVVLDRFHPSTFIESCRQFKATIICYLGVMPAMMMNIPAAESDRNHSLRMGLGAAIPPRLHENFEQRFGFPMIEAYGMTEMGNATMVDPRMPRMVGSGTCGRLCADVEARIVDDNGQDLAVGLPGELLVKGPNLFSGYFADDNANKDAFDSAGWFRTGDMLRCDEGGYYYFIDRIRDVIRRSGENIAAIEVETVLRTHPAVGDVAVIGVPDDIRGQELKACIVLKEDVPKDQVTPEAIADYMGTKLAYFKVPRYFKFYLEFSRTPTLKVRKFQLRSESNDLTVGCWDRLTKSWRKA
jgi:crotonobetaine/carnitine-CoA ligase